MRGRMGMALVVLALACVPAAGQEPVEKAPGETAPGVKRALLICGHPGDAEHARLYAGVLRQIRTALTTRLEFPEPEIRVQFGGTWPSDPARPDDQPLGHGPATRESLAAEVADLRSRLKPDDTLWVIVVGHSHHDGRKTFLNLPGPDLTSVEFGKLFSGLTCREQVFFMTTSVSGFYLKPLAATGRVVISATEADVETNETIYPQVLAEELGKLAGDSPDEDRDGVHSLLDLYIGVARNVAQRYIDEMNLATEHSQLDDNGDGRGTEVQIDWLTVEQGGRNEGQPVPARTSSGDGAVAARLRLTVVPNHDAAPTEP